VLLSFAFAGDPHAVRGDTGAELWSRNHSCVHVVGDVDVDGDPALEVLVANGTQLLALDTVSEAPAAP
jgi:hypothetical protein